MLGGRRRGTERVRAGLSGEVLARSPSSRVSARPGQPEPKRRAPGVALAPGPGASPRGVEQGGGVVPGAVPRHGPAGTDVPGECRTVPLVRWA